MRVLITAGPTREPLDAVRFLSNASTGRMGIEVATAVAAAGDEAVLVLGPTHLPPPGGPGVRVVRVTTAREMLAACEAEWPTCDALVATAAVSDFRPAAPAAGKPEKSRGPVTLELVPNPDVLAMLSATKGARRVVGFAVQVEDAEARARAKMERKRCDLLVLDAPAAMGAERSDFVLLRPGAAARPLPGATKAEVAAAVVAFLRGAPG